MGRAYDEIKILKQFSLILGMNAEVYTLEDIGKYCIQMLLKEPHYAHILMKLPKEISTQVKTATIDLDSEYIVKLVLNPNYWEQLNDQQRYALLKEEMLHLVTKHPVVQKNFPNPSWYQLAAKLTFQQYTSEEIPQAAVYSFSKIALLAKHMGIDFSPKKDIAYYYQQLKNIFERLSTPAYSIPIALIPIKKLLEEISDLALPYPTWEKFSRLDTSHQKIIAYQFDRLIQHSIQEVNYANKDSQLPDAFIMHLNQRNATQKSTINWKRILRLFTNSSPKTYLKNTIRRPSKRYGTSPGFKIKKKQKILLAIDTSGSIQEQEFHRFFREINQVWRQGADLLLIECDTSIRKKYSYKGQAPQRIHGRTGTDFTAAIKFANAQDRLDAIIYFTDGHGMKPNCSSRYPLLWVISSTGISQNSIAWDTLPGKKIKIST